MTPSNNQPLPGNQASEALPDEDSNSQKKINRSTVFVHPAEEAFAYILDFYGLRWEYEPRSFPLERDEAGNVTEAFTPDFYLPDQDLYVELTTIRPKLATFKNRKLRRMKELYPEINIKLFKRREMRDLMMKYGLLQEAQRIQGTQAQEDDL